MSRKSVTLILLLVLCINLMGCQKKTDLEEVQRIYNNIYPDFLEVKRLIYGGKLEIVGEIADENGFPYFILNEPDYQEVTDIELLLKSVFSEKYIRENLDWVLGGDTPLFREINGRLCIAMKDAIGENLSEKITTVIDKEEERILVEIESQDAKYEISIVKYNDNWVIDDIEMK